MVVPACTGLRGGVVRHLPLPSAVAGVFPKVRLFGGGHGFSFALYHRSPYLYLVAITAFVAVISYLVVAGLNTLGKRWRPFGWAYLVLFGR